MSYLPQTEDELDAMLDDIGVDRFDELLDPVPDDVRLDRPLDLPAALAEQDLFDHIRDLADQNRDLSAFTSFLGAGMYQHYVPAVVEELTSRNEFYTAYTPYQAEASQGILQAFYEYQTLICELTDMDVSNASHYDGPTALAEAVLMMAGTEEGTVFVPEFLHPEYRRVLDTYLQFHPLSVNQLPSEGGRVDPDALRRISEEDAAAVIVQHPNFLGHLEPVQKVQDALDGADVPVIGVVDPISTVQLTPPADWGADVAVGDGQSLGNHLYFGGPSFGFISTSEDNLRKLPGRLVGRTDTEDGEEAYVLTLQTREQHIRREKATSNICTNQGLNALQATIWMCALGKQGLDRIARHCVKKSHYLRDRLLELPGVSAPFDRDPPFFREFTVDLPVPASTVNERLLAHGLIGGLDPGETVSRAEHPWLLTATECTGYDEIDQFVDIVHDTLNGTAPTP